MAAQSSLQPWPDVSDDLPIEKVYQKAQHHAHELLPKFKSFLQHFVPVNCQLLTDIKSQSSFIRKAKRKPVQMIHDVLRAAILTQTKDEAKQIAERIKHTSSAKVLEFEYKNGSDHIATGYHGAFHIKIKLADMICEIQVMTETLWVYKERNHSTYTTGQAENDRSVKTFSNWLYDTAEK
jgi:Region found in RelA / SpoT proteins